jgi:hypothetical protein
VTDIVAPLSPQEIMLDFLTRHGSCVGLTVPQTGQVLAAKVGPANDPEKQAGVICFMGAGLPLIEKYIPLQWVRTQVRCLGPDLDTADFLSQCVQRDLHGDFRKEAYQASNDSWYLVHLSNVTSGPSMHFDSPEVWETLLFVEALISSDPLGTGPTPP